jgi:hypothetical protein
VKRPPEAGPLVAHLPDCAARRTVKLLCAPPANDWSSAPPVHTLPQHQRDWLVAGRLRGAWPAGLHPRRPSHHQSKTLPSKYCLCFLDLGLMHQKNGAVQRHMLLTGQILPAHLEPWTNYLFPQHKLQPSRPSHRPFYRRRWSYLESSRDIGPSII